MEMALQFFGGRGSSSGGGGGSIPSSNGRHVFETSNGSVTYEVSSDEIYLNNIIINENNRQSGIGTSMLKKVTAMADRENKPVQLMASPTEGDMSTKQLVNWYEKNGFEIEKSYGSMGARMVYKPKRKR